MKKKIFEKIQTSRREPIIYHGHTITSKIKFRDAITAINQYAFRTSDYPVCISLENHCDTNQQVTIHFYAHFRHHVISGQNG